MIGLSFTGQVFLKHFGDICVTPFPMPCCVASAGRWQSRSCVSNYPVKKREYVLSPSKESVREETCFLNFIEAIYTWPFPRFAEQYQHAVPLPDSSSCPHKGAECKNQGTACPQAGAIRQVTKAKGGFPGSSLPMQGPPASSHSVVCIQCFILFGFVSNKVEPFLSHKSLFCRIVLNIF